MNHPSPIVSTIPAVSRYTGRPVAGTSALALSRIEAATVPVPAREPNGLQRLLRPEARQRWILPQLNSITPQYIERVLRGAFAGSHVEAWELFDLMEDTWPRLAKNLSAIKRGVANLDWKVEPYHDEGTPPTASAIEKARLVGAALKAFRPDPVTDEGGFPAMLDDVMDAWGKGVSVVEILWHLRRLGALGDCTVPRATCWVRPDSYAWSEEGRLGLNPNALEGGERRGRGYFNDMSRTDARSEDLVEFPPDKFLIAISKAKSGHPLTSALLRPLAWWWCAANFSADWLMNLAQIFGLPFRLGYFDQGASAATITQINDALENMGSAAWASFPAGTQIEFKEAGPTANQSPQSELLDRADKNCDLLLLGQTLTSDTGGMGGGGGSMALGQVHASVKDEIIQSAGNWAASVLNAQLVEAIIRQNYGDDDEVPELCPEPWEVEDEKGKAERDSILMTAGLPMPAAWFYERHDIPMPRPGEALVERPAPVSPFGGFGGGPRPPASPAPDAPTTEEETEMKTALAAKDATAKVIDTALEKIAGVEAQWLGGLRPHFYDLIAMAGAGHVSDADFLAAAERFAQEMPNLFAKIKHEKLADLIEGALGAAVVNGAVQGFTDRRNAP